MSSYCLYQNRSLTLGFSIICRQSLHWSSVRCFIGAEICTDFRQAQLKHKIISYTNMLESVLSFKHLHDFLLKTHQCYFQLLQASVQSSGSVLGWAICVTGRCRRAKRCGRCASDCYRTIGINRRCDRALGGTLYVGSTISRCKAIGIWTYVKNVFDEAKVGTYRSSQVSLWQW